jgi:hypothetical protein
MLVVVGSVGLAGLVVEGGIGAFRAMWVTCRALQIRVYRVGRMGWRAGWIQAGDWKVVGGRRISGP